MTGEDGQHGRAQDVTVAGGIGTGQREEATGHPGLKAPAHLEEVDKEGQLAQGRHRRLGVPFDMEPATEGIDGDGGKKTLPRPWVWVHPPAEGSVCGWAPLLALFDGLDASEAGGDSPC